MHLHVKMPVITHDMALHSDFQSERNRKLVQADQRDNHRQRMSQHGEIKLELFVLALLTLWYWHYQYQW